ncbi:hypothetical protein TNIN_150921 [Trichonephila inaurata madagascariensis]|uniref:Uncharacterized protein n=1 Tax=Trichonephila inaurata madagascariensis TaxID=2747483 RepID=A0A8X6Y3E1_9ARAC|nr:hypothetical protein TNIN_150921 [Trichonephila inaurata madagascariensis]
MSQKTCCTVSVRDLEILNLWIHSTSSDLYFVDLWHVSSDNVYYRFSCHRYTEPLTKHLRHSLPIKIPRASGAMTERRSRTDGQVRPDNGTATRGIQHFAMDYHQSLSRLPD